MTPQYLYDTNLLTKQYNEAIQALKDAYKMERSQGPSLFGSSMLKQQYSERYEKLAQEYTKKRQQILDNYKQAHPQWAKARKQWGWLFVVGLIMAMTCCTMALPADEQATTEVTAQQTNAWNADNIPIPYLQDSTQYVSNPDHVLSQPAVNRMNATLRRMESALGVQSVFIVVNHIAGDDPFRMAQDVGNKYGVGHDDRGLVVVVGYQDHSINISPGRKLEADLTDAECHRLEQQYVVPAMRAEKPDSGMIYLTEAVYSLLQKKELPTMSHLSNPQDELDDEVAATMGLTIAAIIAWCVFFLYKNRQYHWLAVVGVTTLLPNPFLQHSTRGSGGGGGFSSGGGGGFSGGSFGGGSFGGGGATSRW